MGSSNQDFGERLNGKTSLIETFGREIGGKLFGAAVNVSLRLNVDLDDFCQDLAESALDIESRYGFVHINTAVKSATNAVMHTYVYGVNSYYRTKGFSEIAIEDKNDPTNPDNSWLDAATFRTGLISGSRVKDNLSDAFAESLETLSDTDRFILSALGEGWKGGEIAAKLGKSPAYITLAKKRLQSAFAWAIA